MEILTPYNVIIIFSITIILSFFFDKISKCTNIPSVLMLILLGVGAQYTLKYFTIDLPDIFPILEILGIIGLIMIVLEAALELELKRDKLKPILKSLLIALIGLIVTTAATTGILYQFIPEMTYKSAWLYATSLSILSSAIIIPSVTGLNDIKKEFHIYESTFSDILGIIMFYFLIELFSSKGGGVIAEYSVSLILTIVVSVIISYAIILVFQRIERQVKLFLLIAVLLLFYAIGKKLHLSSLIMILIFGLVIANMKLFFTGKMKKYLHYEKADDILHELHMVTAETAFVVRTLFFVAFGLTMLVTSLLNIKVALISSLIIVVTYLIRFVILRLFVGKDILPQLFIGPRGLITVLLFYAIPKEFQIASFEPGILFFVIIGTSIIMTIVLIYNNRKTSETENTNTLENDKDFEFEDIMEQRCKKPVTKDIDELDSN